MIDLTRYNIRAFDDYDGPNTIVEISSWGDWVSYDDVYLKIKQLKIALATLQQISEMTLEVDNWDGVTRYHLCQDFTRQALRNIQKFDVRVCNICQTPANRIETAYGDGWQILCGCPDGVPTLPNETLEKIEHVCGLQGFGRGDGSENDVCPACSLSAKLYTEGKST